VPSRSVFDLIEQFALRGFRPQDLPWSMAVQVASSTLIYVVHGLSCTCLGTYISILGFDAWWSQPEWWECEQLPALPCHATLPTVGFVGRRLHNPAADEGASPSSPPRQHPQRTSRQRAANTCRMQVRNISTFYSRRKSLLQLALPVIGTGARATPGCAVLRRW